MPRGKRDSTKSAECQILCVPANTNAVAHPWVAFGMELSNALFWFAGFISLGVFLSRLLFCRGTVCGAAQADTVFSAFLFATWGATVTLMSNDVVFKGGFRRPSPAAVPPPMMKETMA